MPNLTLVSHALCPYVQRAAIALAEKSVPFDRVTINLDHKPDWFLAISPLGKVPLLRVARPGGEEAVLFESNVICEYIEDTQPAPRLHPDDPLERARHRAWMEFGSAILSDVYGMEVATQAAGFTAKRDAAKAKFARVEAALGAGSDFAGPYFAGSAFSLVDAVFAPIFRYFDLFDLLTDTGVLADAPKTRAWRATLAQRPSVKGAVAADYQDRLRAFLVAHDAYLLKLAA